MGSGWSTALVLAISSRSPPVNDNVTSLLTAVGGVLAGSLATFIGASIQRRSSSHEVDDRQGDSDRGYDDRND
jgi:hypothetical protein